MHCAPKCVGRRRGLTLVEVLVVIGIIALLGAIMIPVIGRARGNARLVQCASNLHQFDIAFKGQDPGKPDTRLPPAETWMSVVAQSAAGAHKLLQCPGGEVGDEGTPDGSPAFFHAWRGNGRGNPNGSRLNGEASWRETRSNTAADGSYTSSFKMKPSGPSLVITFKPLGGDTWRATLSQHPGPPYRIDAIILSDGRRFTHLSQGFVVEYDAATGGTHYGFNSLASSLDDQRNGKVVAMDFERSVFDFDGYQTAAAPDDYLPATALSRRHLKKINALLSDGSVQALRADELAPANEIYAIAKRGPNPGTAEPTGAGTSGGDKDKKK
jgi:prepilin-type N-terminal cleavage/methylation domain-containing protein